MVEGMGRRKRKAGEDNKAQTQIQGTMGVAVPEEIRNEMSQILTNLITKAQELGFELATIDDPELLKHPIVGKAREVIIELKKLFQVMKKMRG